MKTDPIINVTTSEAKTIAEIICKEIKVSREKNSPRYERARRCERQYSQVTKWMSLNKICDTPWKGAADYFVPLTEWTIDAVHAREMNVLFSQEPYMTAHGVESSDVDKSPGVTDFVDTIFREVVKLRQNIDYFIKQKKKLPFAICKYDWVQDFEPQIVKEEAVKFVSPTGEESMLLPDDPEGDVKVAEMTLQGYQQSQETEDVWVLKDTEIINSPQLRYINFEDYVYSQFAKRGNRLYWEGDRFWMTPNDMKMKSLQEKFRKEGVDNVLKDLNLGDMTGSERIVAERQALRECYWWYGRLPFNKANELDMTDDESIEQEVITIVDFKSQELLFISHWDKGRLAWTGSHLSSRVYIRGEFEETGEFEGRSLVEKLYMTQKYLNQFYNTLMNNAWLAMQKIFVKKKTLQTDEWDKPEAYPGAMWEEDNQGDIRTLEVGDVKSIGMDLNNQLIGFAERMSNISIYQTGTSRKEGGQKTKGEVVATIQEGNIGLDKIIQDDHEILRIICQWTVDYYYENMPPGMERRIRGDDGELLFPTKANMGMYEEKGVNPHWQRDDLAGAFDFVWNGTSLNVSKENKIAVANDLQERFLPHPMVAGSLLATWDILRRGLQARGIKDWKNILPPKEAILAEMKRMQAQQKIEEKRQQIGSPTQMAIQKAEQSDIPREEAIKMVQERVKSANAERALR